MTFDLFLPDTTWQIIWFSQFIKAMLFKVFELFFYVVAFIAKVGMVWCIYHHFESLPKVDAFSWLIWFPPQSQNWLQLYSTILISVRESQLGGPNTIYFAGLLVYFTKCSHSCYIFIHHASLSNLVSGWQIWCSLLLYQYFSCIYLCAKILEIFVMSRVGAIYECLN